MNKITVTTTHNGEVTNVVEKNLTEAELERLHGRINEVKEAKRKMHDRIAERLSKIPPIHFEILKEANKVSKEELLVRYPEHAEFIVTIQ
jgi:hypothetical protein